MQERIKEYDRDIPIARTQNSAVLERTNETGHLSIKFGTNSSLFIMTLNSTHT